MPVVPFLPLIASGASALGGAFAAKKAQAAAQKRSPEELAALTGAQGAAGTLSTGGKEALTTGAETQAPATNYFKTLLSGNRAQQSQAVAAPTAAISDIYSGASRNLEQSGVRGAQKDVATADLGRQRAGQIAGLVTGVQPAAANALTSIGQVQQQRGAGMTAQAGATYSNLLGQGSINREYARGEGEKAGDRIGSLIFDTIRGVGGSFGKKPLLPSRQTVPPFGNFLPGGSPQGM